MCRFKPTLPGSLAMTKPPSTTRSQRPKALTVFAAAFVAGAVAAVWINRVLDIHVAQAKPQVECEPIFVALRDLPQGSAVTIWDVALRDWPKAMLPTTALRADDSFEGMLVKHPVREGQPLLSVQLVVAEARTQPSAEAAQVAEMYEPRTFRPAPASQPDAILWTAGDEPVPQSLTVVEQPASEPSIAEVTAAEQATPEPDVIVPESTISAAAIYNVVNSADIPTEADGDEPSPVTSLDHSASSISAPPERPAAAGEPAQPIDPAQQIVPAQSDRTPAQPVATTPMRYLVVPERIAVQAEASFVSPTPQATPAQPKPVETAQQAQAAPARGVRSEQAPPLTTTAAVTRPAATQRSPQTPVKGPTPRNSTARSTGVPRVAQAPTLETHPNTEPQQPPSAFDGLFPNLRATFGAVDEELQKMRRDRPSQEGGVEDQRQTTAAQGRRPAPQQQATPQKKSQQPRSARWPWSFGS